VHRSLILTVCATLVLLACSEIYGEVEPAVAIDPDVPRAPSEEPRDATVSSIVDARASSDANVVEAAATDAGDDELLARTITLADGADLHLLFAWKRAVGTTAARDMAIYLGAGSPLLTVRTRGSFVEASVYLLSWIDLDEEVTHDLRLHRTGTRVDVEISPPLGKMTTLAQTETTDPTVRVILPNAAKLAAPIRLVD
jgi:hypothetical protein